MGTPKGMEWLTCEIPVLWYGYGYSQNTMVTNAEHYMPQRGEC